MNDPLVALFAILGLFFMALSGIPTIHRVAPVLAAVAFGVATVLVIVTMTHA